MLLKKATLDAIVEGRVDRAFRRWKRPTVKAGGRLRSRVGVLSIRTVEPVGRDEVTEAEARRAGSASRAELLALLDAKTEGEIWRVTLAFAGADERIELRGRVPDAEELADLERRLDAMDARAADGPWTREWLGLLARRPATRAEDLAHSLGLEKKPFKARVRRLKELGLTESLEVGYRLSPRGEALLPPARRRKA